MCGWSLQLRLGDQEDPGHGEWSPLCSSAPCFSTPFTSGSQLPMLVAIGMNREVYPNTRITSIIYLDSSNGHGKVWCVMSDTQFILTPRPVPLLARHGPDLPLHWRGCEGQGHCEDPAQLRPGLRLVRGGGVSGPGSLGHHHTKGVRRWFHCSGPMCCTGPPPTARVTASLTMMTTRTVATICMFGGGHVVTSASKSSIRRFVITEMAPSRAFSWLKASTTAFIFKTLC